MLKRFIGWTFFVSVFATSAAASAVVCPLLADDGGRLSSLRIFEVVDGMEYELAPEEEGNGLAWALVGMPNVTARVVCEYTNGSVVRVEVPEGESFQCRTSVTPEGSYAEAIAFYATTS